MYKQLNPITPSPADVDIDASFYKALQRRNDLEIGLEICPRAVVAGAFIYHKAACSQAQ
jgi:hypothetical protein